MSILEWHPTSFDMHDYIGCRWSTRHRERCRSCTLHSRQFWRQYAGTQLMSVWLPGPHVLILERVQAIRKIDDML